MAELTGIADRLYGGSPGAFIDARNAAARGCGDKALAAQLKKLKKPSVAAWAINLLVRRESEQMDSVLEIGESLRAAAEALDGEELRALTRQRRQLTAALASTARSLAREAGVRLTEPVVDQVEGMLNAAMLDPVAARVLRTGRVLTAFTATGVDDLDVAAVVALPDALEVRATSIGGVPQGARVAGLRVVPDNGAKLAAAQDALAEAVASVTVVEADFSGFERAIETLNARRLQLQGEADELRRRLAAIEDDVDSVDDELEETEEAKDEAGAALVQARRARAEAEQALARLRALE